MVIYLNNSKGFKVNSRALPEEDKKKLTDSYLLHAINSLKEYNQILLKYNEGYLDKAHKDDLCTEIFQKSGYSDMWDFIYDLKRFQVGLPIYVEIKLFRKEDL